MKRSKKITKKEGLEIWSKRIADIRKVYNESIKKQNKNIAFKNTDIYKELNRKKKRSEYYYNNRKRINKDRKERAKRVKRLGVLVDSGDFRVLDDITLYEAFSGNGRLFEAQIRKRFIDKKFLGIIKFQGRRRNYIDATKYQIEVNRILKTLYEKVDGAFTYSMMEWRVERSWFFEKKTNTLFVGHRFYSLFDEEENDEENEYEYER